MRRTILAFLAGSLLLSIASAAPQATSPYATLRAQAEREFAQKSYARARVLYEEAAKLDLAPDDRQWVVFRIADTTLRADVASPDADPRTRTKAREAIETLIDAREDAAEERAGDAWSDFDEQSAVDEFSAEMREALGDSFLLHPYDQSAHTAQSHYREALGWWARSSDLERARRRYLDIVWRLAEHSHGRVIARDFLVDAVAIATTDQDRARARYLLASQYVQEGAPQSVDRGLQLLEETIAIGRGTSVYDDALFLLASQLAGRGRSMAVGPDGESLHDYARALALYRRLVAEFRRGETQYFDAAQQGIREITAPSLDVQVAGTFLPESRQELILSWCNVASVALSLVAVDLTTDVSFDGNGDWMRQIATEGRPVVRQWTFEPKTSDGHRPGREVIELEPRLPVGAYVVLAKGDAGISDRTLLLVTDAHILAHAGAARIDTFVSDVETGQPIANARIRHWHRNGRNVTAGEARGDANGFARVTPGERNGSLLITASAGARQAYHQLYSYWYRANRNEDAAWRIYAFTDRPAYRPGETVKWKILARVRESNQWITPDGESLAYEVTGPRGDKVAEGIAKLSAFGSFWAELPLTDAMALGTYNVSFRKVGTKEQYRGHASLFRLEEYKLPEFRVTIATAGETRPRLGDTIEATIDVQYYFGGPVANAQVEAVVYEEPFYRLWPHPHEYGWLYPPRRPAYQRGRVRETQSLRTDAEGRAVLRFDTPRDGTEMSYRIEARVIDASRREVVGAGEVRVLRQRYSVMAQPEHFVHRPGDSVSIDFKARDANDQPVQARGTVTVVRRTHVDPPKPLPEARDRRRRIAPVTTKDEEVLRTELATDAKGEATLTFKPKTTGHYIIRWTSVEGARVADSVVAETAVFVSERTTTELGYRTAGLDLILDRDTVKPGESATVMIVTPSAGRWVAITTSADDLVESQVVRMEGTVRLLQIPIDESSVPAVFIDASSVFDREVAHDAEQIVVPPAARFLNVEVTTDRAQYEPRQQGTVTVTTRDAAGKPVAAEVALSVSDDAVTAIQEDLAGDPRAFFYGEMRTNPLRMSAGLQTQQYVLLQEQPAGDDLAEERVAREELGLERAADGAVAGRVGNTPPPAPPPAPTAVSESITVTAQAAAVLPPGTPAGAPIEVTVRSDFRSTAFWQPDVVTGADGTATVTLTYPEALTTWRATARAATTGAEFGMNSESVRTTMPLLVRLQAPRFFVAGDRAIVSAVMNNNTDEPLVVTPELAAEGLRLEGAGAAQSITIAPQGEARADWTVRAEALPAPSDAKALASNREPSQAKLTVTARSSKFADAMERTLPVYEHGIDKLVARSGKLRGEEALIRLDLPRARRATELTVQIAPSIAVTMLDALPYLIEFPYGCTEQTMSRFLPAAIVANTIERLNLGTARVAGKPLDAVVSAGLARLYDMQQDDGSWGWWKESAGDAFMTAYVVWGFAIARDAGIDIDAGAVDRAAIWLDERLVTREKQIHDQVWMLHALSAWRKAPSAAGTRALENAWTKRETLTAYSRALLALTAHRWGQADRARILVKNLEDGVKVDRTPDQSVLLKGETAAETMATAHWGASGFWWRWYEGPVETTAFVLQALVTIEPRHRLVEPAMNWLVKNRRGTKWNNTRDTAIALLAMNDYLEQSGELSGDVAYELTVNGRVLVTKRLTARDALRAPSRFAVPADALTDATQEIRIRRTSGDLPLYFAAEARFVSLEEPVTAAGNELFVRREYFRLVPRPTLLRGVAYDRVPLRDGESIASGDRIEVVVTVETKNDYEYLLFEDLKPAGFEAVAVQSGGDVTARNLKTNAQVYVYQELRDRHVALFADRLEQGIWEMRYPLRAEVPGEFHALPLLGQAMYVPDVRANGAEVRVIVVE